MVDLMPQEKITYSALADEVYVRDAYDQAFSLEEIDDEFVDADPALLDVDGIELRRSGSYYYSDNGFAARVIQDDGNYIVVFHGTDTAVSPLLQVKRPTSMRRTGIIMPA